MSRSALAALLLCAGLTACGTNQPNGNGEPTTPSPTHTAAEGEKRRPTLKVKETALGEIIVDGKGRTVYAYAADDQGAARSTCEGGCLKAWPPVSAPKRIDVDAPGDAGVTESADGKRQLTYNGWPLYYYARDTEPGDTKGHGVKGEWSALDETGEKVEHR